MQDRALLLQLRTYCCHLADRIALIIYASKKITISLPQKRRFAMRLFRSARRAPTPEAADDRLFEVQQAIFAEYQYHSLRMWAFCGAAVVRLSFQIAAFGGREVRFSEVPALRRSLFRYLRKARDDEEVNARVGLFFNRALVASGCRVALNNCSH